jgi:23S rRNA pseudouridine2605 synthase
VSPSPHGDDKGAPPGEKLQKILARLGYGSRRELEQWIADGRVSVDGKLARLGDRVTEEQQIRVDGRPVNLPQEGLRRRVLVYYKPEGEVCSRSDPQGRPTIFDHLPGLRAGRWVAVGRLDLNSQGLMLLTNDGELANRLMHPRYEIEREYAVRVLGEVTDDMVQQLKKGVELEDGLAKFDTIVDAGGEGANHWYHVTLHEGRNREVRRMWEAVGVKVSRLTRVRFGPLRLPRNLRVGNWEQLDDNTLAPLLEKVGLKAERRQQRPQKRDGRKKHARNKRRPPRPRRR